MKRFLKWSFYFLLVCLFLHTCVYHRMTHMNKEEVEWATNRHKGEMMYFKSTNGTIDTVEICNVSVSNSLNPFTFAYFNTSNEKYTAGILINYAFNGSTACEGTLLITKSYNDKPIYFSGGLFRVWSKKRIILNLSKLVINDVVFDDVVVFDDSNMAPITDLGQSNHIKSFAWSKKYGLVQYAYQDGTVFSRIGIRQHEPQ